MDQCVSIFVGLGDRMFLLSCIYGATNTVRRRGLWNHLRDIRSHNSHIPWACIGDFNAYTCVEDKSGGADVNRGSMKDFNDCIVDCELSDLIFSGPRFIWSNGRVHERLDRCLVNTDWLSVYESSRVLHLNQLKSDHRPLLLKMGGLERVRVTRNNFYFQAAWLTHEGFPDLVATAWERGNDWLTCLKSFASSARDWNFRVFGNIFM